MSLALEEGDSKRVRKTEEEKENYFKLCPQKKPLQSIEIRVSFLSHVFTRGLLNHNKKCFSFFPSRLNDPRKSHLNLFAFGLNFPAEFEFSEDNFLINFKQLRKDFRSKASANEKQREKKKIVEI